MSVFRRVMTQYTRIRAAVLVILACVLVFGVEPTSAPTPSTRQSHPDGHPWVTPRWTPSTVTLDGVPLLGSDGGDRDKHAARIIRDVLDWWATDPMPGVIPDMTALSFAVFSSSDPAQGVRCGGRWERTAGAAAYCLGTRTVYWERLLNRPSVMTFTLAHEIAHHVDSVVYKHADLRDRLAGEQFADCLAGAHFRSADPTPEDVDTQRRIVAGYGDDVLMASHGHWDADDYNGDLFNLRRHGTSQERVRAWTVGFEAGAAQCHRVKDTPKASPEWLKARGYR